MASPSRQRELFEHVERLRWVLHRRWDPQLSAVRAWLEDELGPSVSLRCAAGLLGVTHASLARWTSRGELATVLTPAGRRELPVGLLLDLRELVAAERERGTSHVLEAIVQDAHSRAAALRPRDLVADTAPLADGHRWAELRGLAYHRAIAPRLTQAQINEGRHRLARWQTRGQIDVVYASMWEQLLAGPVAALRAAITADTAAGNDLRQNTPLTGLLTEHERQRLISELG